LPVRRIDFFDQPIATFELPPNPPSATIRIAEPNTAGFASGGKAETLTQGVPTTGRIPNGALVEREAPGRLMDEKALVLELRNPDFNTAVNVADAINAHTVTRYGVKVARENDLRTITVHRPFFINSTRLLADIGELAVETDVPARVVIDERTGTIVIGKDVQISTVAVAHGNLTVRVTESARVSQPLPFSRGETTVAPETTISAEQRGGNFAIVRGTNLQTLVAGLNRIGLKPNGIIAILQAIKSAGALQADLVGGPGLGQPQDGVPHPSSLRPHDGVARPHADAVDDGSNRAARVVRTGGDARDDGGDPEGLGPRHRFAHHPFRQFEPGPGSGSHGRFRRGGSARSSRATALGRSPPFLSAQSKLRGENNGRRRALESELDPVRRESAAARSFAQVP
jgi:hypothetical protein